MSRSAEAAKIITVHLQFQEIKTVKITVCKKRDDRTEPRGFAGAITGVLCVTVGKRDILKCLGKD